MTPEQAGEVYSRLLAARDAVDVMIADLKVLAKQTPLPLPSGKVLTQVEKSETSPDAEKVLLVLGRLYGAEAAQDALTTPPPPKASWKSIREFGERHVLPELQVAWDQNRGSKRGRRPSAGTVATELRKTLEAAGAVKVTGWVEVREVAPESNQLMSTSEEET